MGGGHFPIEECFFGTVKIGDRGQIVIPAEARHALGFKPGDKLIVARDPAVEGLVIARVDALQDVVDYLSGMIARAADGEGEEEQL